MLTALASLTRLRRKYRSYLRPVVYGAIWVVDRVVPKTRQAVLAVNPDFDDQGLAIADELTRRRIPVVWLTHVHYSEKELAEWPRPPGRVLGRYTVRGLWAYFRSRYVFYTHGIFGYARPPASKIVVNLWHGMPIKQIGLMDGREPMRATFTVATSELFQRIISRAWDLTVDQVPITGLPRNDRMLRAVGDRRVQLTQSRVVLWMPTYRRSIVGDIRMEGRADHTSPGGLRDFDRSAFEFLLRELDSICIIKVHPMADPADYPSATERVWVWGENDLWKRRVTLAELLAMTDVLVTDVSSVWVDYLLLRRPIVFAFGDQEQYRRDRGFTDDHPLPGPVVRDYPHFEQALRHALGHADPTSDLAYQEMHAYHDDDASSRVVDFLERLEAST